MQKKNIIFTSIVATLLFAISFNSYADSPAPEPTTTWPYIYQEFMDGEIYLSRQQKVLQKVNVHLGHAKIHFLDANLIKELVLNDVVAVMVGKDRYVPYEGSMYKVVASNDKALLLEQSLGDFAALEETGGAYGSSSASSATMKLSSVDDASMLGRNHMMVRQSRHEGKTLPLITKYYIKTPEFFCKASKKELDQQFSDRADQWKTWLKANKIKWNNPESLSKILEFLK